MATEAWSTRLRHDDDATYQEWRDELVAKLTSAGLAPDETTVVAASGSRPGTTTEESYAVFHLDDALHATSPIYIRFGFGTGGGATTPRVQVTVGTSTNGSGVIGGTAKTLIRSIHQSVAATSDLAKSSYLCVNEGFVGLGWKIEAAGSWPDGLLIICRTCDSSGVPTALGAMVVHGSGQSALTATQALRFTAPATAFTAQTSAASQCLGFNPQARADSAVGSDLQVFLGWTIAPQVLPLFGVVGLIPGEIVTGVTFSATPVGVTQRTFIALDGRNGTFSHTVGSDGNLKFAMLWE